MKKIFHAFLLSCLIVLAVSCNPSIKRTGVDLSKGLDYDADGKGAIAKAKFLVDGNGRAVSADMLDEFIVEYDENGKMSPMVFHSADGRSVFFKVREAYNIDRELLGVDFDTIYVSDGDPEFVLDGATNAYKLAMSGNTVEYIHSGNILIDIATGKAVFLNRFTITDHVESDPDSINFEISSAQRYGDYIYVRGSSNTSAGSGIYRINLASPENAVPVASDRICFTRIIDVNKYGIFTDSLLLDPSGKKPPKKIKLKEYEGSVELGGRYLHGSDMSLHFNSNTFRFGEDIWFLNLVSVEFERLMHVDGNGNLSYFAYSDIDPARMLEDGLYDCDGNRIDCTEITSSGFTVDGIRYGWNVDHEGFVGMRRSNGNGNLEQARPYAIVATACNFDESPAGISKLVCDSFDYEGTVGWADFIIFGIKETETQGVFHLYAECGPRNIMVIEIDINGNGSLKIIKQVKIDESVERPVLYATTNINIWLPERENVTVLDDRNDMLYWLNPDARTICSFDIDTGICSSRILDRVPASASLSRIGNDLIFSMYESGIDVSTYSVDIGNIDGELEFISASKMDILPLVELSIVQL